MRRGKVMIVHAALAVAMGFLGPGPSAGQPMDLATPSTSPLWWTLTDQVSPSDLRQALRDPKAHLERYRAAVAAGAALELTEEQVQVLSFYYNRELTPELTPMWLAFSAFATGHLDMRGEEYTTVALEEFGFDPLTIDLILQFAEAQSRRSQDLARELAEKSIPFVEIQRRAIQARGGDRKAYAAVKRAAEQGNLEEMLGSTELSLQTLADLRTAWLRNPITEVAEELLPDLRSRLKNEDWERFRKFLLEHVVPAMGNESKDFDWALGVEP